LAEIIAVIAGLVAIGAAIVRIAVFLRARRPNQITDLANKVFHLGELIEETYTYVQMARFEAAEPAILAAELQDSRESTANIWDVAEDTSNLSNREIRDLKRLCDISRNDPIDYAVFIAAVPLYLTWSKIQLIGEELQLTDRFSEEASALRDASFRVIAGETRILSSIALSCQGEAKSVERNAYRVDRSMETLAVSLGYARTQGEASVFLTGAALSRIDGAISVAEELAELSISSGASKEGVVEKVLNPVQDATLAFHDHVSSCGFSSSEFSGEPETNTSQPSLYLKRWRKIHSRWRTKIMRKLGVEEGA
jgi:hypothetical protein